MDAFRNFLQQFPNFTPEAYELAAPFLSSKELKSGELLLELGSICREIAFIEKGIFRLYYLNDGKEVTLCFCNENNITASHRSFAMQSSSEIAIEAIEPSKVILMSYESLQKLYNLDAFWQQVGRLVVEEELMRNQSHNRFLKDLSATDRYLKVLESDKDLIQRIPLHYLATYLQIAPETLSRIRNKIART